MSKKRISTRILICLLALILCFTTSCKKEEETPTGPVKDKPGTVYVLNPFETDMDLFSIRHANQWMSAGMEIVKADNGQVKAGKGSMKYTFERGNWPDMVLHIKQTSYPNLDIANLNKMNLAVYNDNEKAVNCVVSVVVGGNKALLTKEFTLEPGKWNDLEFRLSALACKFNAEQILGFRFRMEAEEGSVFYFDEWSVTMGAENTEEDNEWEPQLLGIIDKINKLPQDLTIKDGEMLETLYMDYAKLPDVYRNIVPNYDKLYTTLKNYVNVAYAAEEDGLERKFLAFDEFYGIGQISSANYAMQYQTDVKFGDDKGSIKVTFDGSTKESYFPYSSPLDAKRYDYMEISFYNDDDTYRKVFYFNWNQRLVVEPKTWGTMKIKGEELLNSGNIIVDTIDEQGTRIQSRGTVYMGAMRAYRRDLAAELNKLPNAADFEMKRDIKYLTLIENTMALYNKTPESDKVNLSKEQVENLFACYEKIDGYKTVFDATQEDLEFGTPDCPAIGNMTAEQDELYGPVWSLTFTDKPNTDYVAGFRFLKDFSGSSNMFFYIYNPQPTAQTMELYADGSWKNLEMRTLEPGWNEIEIPADVPVNYFIFGLFSKNADVVGTWKVSSLYAATDDLVNQDAANEVSALIQALPDASKIWMPEGIKYVADIWEAYEAYEALGEDGKSRVPQNLKGKLDACMKAIEGYKAAMNPNTDEMTVGTPDCECFGSMQIKWDDTYGPVYALYITGASTGDYAAGFQINKDISADKNLYFYIFNPQETAQTMYLYANPAWDNMGERVLNPGWNLIELPKDAKIDRYLFGLFPKNATVTGQWLITSVFSKTDAIVDREASKATADMIEALPDPDSLSMPEDMKLLASIYQAGDSYKALSDAAKAHITDAQYAKLQACLDAVDGYFVAINALSDDMTVGTADAPCYGTMDRLEDDTYGPVFGLNIVGAGTGDYAGGFQVNKNISLYRNLFFYIYNPQETAQVMYLYADPSWKSLNARTLEPGWNLIELPNDVQIEGYIFGIFPATTEVVGQWKITSVYALSDELIYGSEVAEVEAMIQALKDAQDLTLEDKTAVDAAKAAYDALPEAAKALVSAEHKAKLDACVATMEELCQNSGYEGVIAMVNALPEANALGGSHKQAVLDAKAAYDALPEDQKAKVTNAQKLLDCVAKVTEWKVWEDKIVIDSATTDLIIDGTVVKNTDDNTFGTVWSISGGTWIRPNGSWLTGDAMEFYIYNPTSSDVSAYYTADWNVNVYVTLKANSWTKVPIQDTAEQAFITQAKDIYMYFTYGDGWKVSSFYTAVYDNTEAETVEAVNALIAALPEANALGGSHKQAVLDAKAAYDALSAAQQAQVENVEKLNACLDKLAQWKVWEDKIVIDSATTDLIIDGTVVKNTDDNTFGTVWSISGGTWIRPNGGWLTGDAMEFYIYNPTDSDVSGYYTADWTVNVNFTLTANSWTRILIQDTAEQAFITQAMDIYMYFTYGDGWKVSSFYAAEAESNEDEAVVAVNGLIAALPEANALGGSHKQAVLDAKAAYDALSAAQQEQVENVEKLNACLDKLAQWKVWEDKIVKDAATDAMQSDGTVTVNVDDNTYGIVTSVTGGSWVKIPADWLVGDAVEFYVYNPKTEDVKANFTDGPWAYVNTLTLTAQSWTRIVIADNPNSTDQSQQLMSNKRDLYLYINFGTDGWKISSVYAAEVESNEDEAVVAVNGLIAALPEANALGGSHKQAVLDAKAAYDALSAAQQAQVENVEKLNACVEKVNAWNALADKIVVDAATQILGVDGTITQNIDDNAFGTVWSVSNSTYLAITPNAMNGNPAYKTSKAIGFYIYNPTNSDIDGYYTIDWNYNGYFRLHANSWNYIEITDFGAAANKQMISNGGTVYLYAAYSGSGWKVSSFYGQSAGYADVKDLPVVVDAASQVLGVDGTLTPGVDDAEFGKVMSVSNSTYLAITPNVMNGNPAYKTSDAIIFYIYNPTSSDIDGYYTIDWNFNGYFRLKANSWNRIVISDLGSAANKQMISNGGTVYFYAAFSGTGWKVSSFYGLNVPETTASVAQKWATPAAVRFNTRHYLA